MKYDDWQRSEGGCAAYFLPVERISPRASLHGNPESPQTLRELAGTISREGLKRPVTVRRMGSGRYEIVSGNRRLLACRLLGWTHIEAFIQPERPQRLSAGQLLAAVASGQLHYLDAADALHVLNTEHGMSWHTLAGALGSTAQEIAARSCLHVITGELRTLMVESGLPERMAHTFLRLPDDWRRLDMARRAARERLCIRDVELLVTAMLRRRQSLNGGRRVINLTRDHRPYINAIRDIAGQMQDAGVPVTFTERQVGRCTELIVSMPARRRRSERHQSMDASSSM